MRKRTLQPEMQQERDSGTARYHMIDIRLFYILAAILFGFNATYVGSAEAMPFYLITSGDLVRLIWAVSYTHLDVYKRQ